MSRWRLLALLFLINVMTYVDRVNIAVAGALRCSALGLLRVELGAMFSAFAFGYALPDSRWMAWANPHSFTGFTGLFRINREVVSNPCKK